MWWCVLLFVVRILKFWLETQLQKAINHIYQISGGFAFESSVNFWREDHFKSLASQCIRERGCQCQSQGKPSNVPHSEKIVPFYFLFSKKYKMYFPTIKKYWRKDHFKSLTSQCIRERGCQCALRRSYGRNTDNFDRKYDYKNSHLSSSDGWIILNLSLPNVLERGADVCS